MRGATYCYELHINHPFSPADWAEVFSKIGITKGVSQKTLAEWTRFSNTSSDGYKLLGGVYFFSSHGTIYAIDGKKDFRKNSPKPLVNYAQEGDAYKGKRLKKRMINQKIPIFRRNFIRVERVK